MIYFGYPQTVLNVSFLNSLLWLWVMGFVNRNCPVIFVGSTWKNEFTDKENAWKVQTKPFMKVFLSWLQHSAAKKGTQAYLQLFPTSAPHPKIWLWFTESRKCPKQTSTSCSRLEILHLSCFSCIIELKPLLWNYIILFDSIPIHFWYQHREIHGNEKCRPEKRVDWEMMYG